MRQKSEIYTPKRDDKHRHACHMGAPPLLGIQCLIVLVQICYVNLELLTSPQRANFTTNVQPPETA